MKNFIEIQDLIAARAKKDYRITKDYLTSVHGIRTLPYLSNLKEKKYVYGSNWAKVIRGNPVILLPLSSASKPTPICKTDMHQCVHMGLLSVSIMQANKNKDL